MQRYILLDFATGLFSADTAKLIQGGRVANEIAAARLANDARGRFYREYHWRAEQDENEHLRDGYMLLIPPDNMPELDDIHGHYYVMNSGTDFKFAGIVFYLE